MTGREAVEYFAKLHHIGKIKSIYFNRVENRHYRPYDLRSVVKNKVGLDTLCVLINYKFLNMFFTHMK